MTVSETVRLWFGERIATGAVARDTEAYNQVGAALPDLIGRLEALAPSSAAVSAASPAPTGEEAAVEPEQLTAKPGAAQTAVGEPAAEDHPAA